MNVLIKIKISLLIKHYISKIVKLITNKELQTINK